MGILSTFCVAPPLWWSNVSGVRNTRRSSTRQVSITQGRFSPVRLVLWRLPFASIFNDRGLHIFMDRYV